MRTRTRTTTESAGDSTPGFLKGSLAAAAILAVWSCASTTEIELEGGLPRGRIAVSALHGPIRLTTVTGTGERILITGNVNAQDWSPAGDRLVYVDDRGNGEYALSLTDTLGGAVHLPVPLRSTWPEYSRDGWIYFFTQNNEPPRIYRIRPNGTGLQNLMAGSFSSPAPSGPRIAVALPGGIWIGDPKAGGGSVIPSTAVAIILRWSPDGEWIAYRSQGGGVTLVRPDGSARSALDATGVGGLSWSSDSRWLLAGNGGPLQLFDTRSGVRTDLAVTGTYPAFKR